MRDSLDECPEGTDCLAITEKMQCGDGDDAEYFETATENPLQHTANASAIIGMHIWNSPTPAAPV